MANAIATVTLELTWDEARALCALVGKVNGRTVDRVWGALIDVVGDETTDEFSVVTGGTYDFTVGHNKGGTPVKVISIRDLTKTGE